jgi:hypothetical protein
MRFHPVIFEAFDAARDGEARREADRRAMYARPDALPLPEEPPRVSLFARLIAMATRPRVDALRGQGRETADSL